MHLPRRARVFSGSLAFGYDAAGNRVRKEFTDLADNTTQQWYVRDAQGNILSIYKKVGGGSLKQNTTFMYGSGRLGELIINRDSAVAWNRHYYRIKGNRHYELTNHLGNVLAVVTVYFGGNFTTRFGGNFTTRFGGNFTTRFGGNFTTPEQACQG